MRNGFYKNDGEMLLYGANRIVSNEYQIFVQNKDDYDLPIDGWYYFDDEDDAYTFFGLEKPVDEPPPGHPDYVDPFLNL